MAENTATPAPAAAPPAPSNAAPAPPTAVDDDAQIVEDLRKEHFAKQGEKDPDEIDIDVEEDEAEEPEEKPAKDNSKGKKEPEVKVKAPRYKTANDALAAITKALESGDPKKIAEAIGKPESFLKVNDAKWIAFREQTSALRERTREVVKRERDFNAKLEQAEKDHGPIIEAKAAYREGKFDKFVELVEQLTGDPYEEATRKVVKGETSLSPEVKALRKQMAEQAAEIARLKKGPEQTPEQRAERVVAAVRQDLADHVITRLKGYERQVIDRVRESWDPDIENYTMSFEEAADAIVEERRQESRNLARGKQLPPPRERASEPPPRARASDPHSSPGADWEKRDLSEEELVASIERDYRAGKLRHV